MEEYQDYFDFEEEKNFEVRTFLEFVISGKIFAVETSEVLEIVQLGEVTPVPEFPKYIMGLANVKGQSVAVIDTAYRFGTKTAEVPERRCVIICKTDCEKSIGIVADDVLKLKDVDVQKVSESPKINGEAFTRYITCMYLRQTGDPCFVVSPVLMMSEDEKSQIL